MSFIPSKVVGTKTKVVNDGKLSGAAVATLVNRCFRIATHQTHLHCTYFAKISVRQGVTGGAQGNKVIRDIQP